MLQANPHVQGTAHAIVWVGLADDPYLQLHLPALTQQGLTIEVSEVERTPEVVADLRVLPEWAFDQRQRLEVEYPLDPRPTLLLGKSADSVAELLHLANNSDEVGHAGEGAATLLRRIARLAGRADSYRRAGESGNQDAQTGLWNRQRLTEEAERWHEASLDGTGSIGLLLLDLDRFKQINDQLGHAAGDIVLKRSAGAIRRSLQAGDFGSRFGGEEFAVLIRRPTDFEVLEQAEVVRAQIGRIELKGLAPATGSVAVSASGGLVFHRPGLSPQDWFHRADMALYEAKSQGRDRLVSYEALSVAGDESGSDLQVRHFQNVTRVVTERVASLISLMGQQVVRSIQKDANQDALTLSFNRRYFDKRMAREFALVSKDGRPLTLAFLDIDNFGQFNRSYGAPTGDAVLRQFAALVAAAIRPVDWLARYGGEEFCVVMPASIDEACQVAERLRASVADAELKTFDGQGVHITVSIGVAERQSPAERPEDLVQRASKALQQAKQAGRNRVCAAGRG